jgi:Tol biopolymer transport system component
MDKNFMYNELLSVAKKENWRMVNIQQRDIKTNIATISVHSFKENITRDVYSYPFWALDRAALISNNSEKVVFRLNEDSEKDGLYIADTKTFEVKKIIPFQTNFGLSWSNDSKKIAFVGSATEEDIEKSQRSLFIVDVETGEIKIFLKGDVDSITHQSFSPDDSKIVFVKRLSSKNCIMIYDFNKNESFQLTEGDSPVWSPDGRWIAYFDGNNELMIISPDGKNKKKLVANSISLKSRSMKGMLMGPIYWFPNGEYFFYTKCPGLKCEIGAPYVISISTRKSQRILQDDWIFSSWGSE